MQYVKCFIICLCECYPSDKKQNKIILEMYEKGLRSDAEKRELSDSLGPLTETFSAPLPAPLVKTLKSATSFTLTPLG